MGRRRKGEPIHGWLIVDKPKGLTSTAVVNRVRRDTHAAKVGHGGTLDPLATGLLPVPARRRSRVARGLATLVERGLATTYAAWRGGAELAPPAQPIDEAGRCARWIADRWL